MLAGAALLPLLLLLGSAASSVDVQPALDLVARNFGAAAAASLSLSVDDSACASADSKNCFVLSQSGAKIAVAASSMSELTYGIGHYARFSCGLTVGWARGGGSFAARNQSWPCHGAAPLEKVTKARAVPYSYEDNVCTHSYSYVWYDADQWTAHIDWMALQGVNVFLAMTGQEEVQYKAFQRFGLKDAEIREFFNGPAFLTWSRGQSMQSVGSSAEPEGGESGLPRSWMQAQHALQKHILKLSRSLGIIGVLPAFQGNMPPQIKALHPTANISVTRHSDGYNDNKGGCAWVASTDPLFGKVADAWMEITLEDFGTDHWYQCDGFFTGAKPPWLDTDAATDEAAEAAVGEEAWDGAPVEPSAEWTPVWKAAWEGMARTDPKAHWLYQGWAIRGWNNAAGASRIKALFEAVPKGQWIPLDMDIKGIWRYFGNYSFFGAPFIWTTLHNMGGNDGMKGDMRMLEVMPSDALAAGATIVGTGATPEGIDQNPAYYEYTFDTAWNPTAQPLDGWFASYASRRYGNTANADAAAAWKILSTAVYNSQAGGWHDNTGVEWNALSAPPTGAMAGGPGRDGCDPKPCAVPINVTGVFEAWRLLASAGQALDPTTMETLNYDIANTGREVLAQLITRFEANLTAAVKDRDRQAADTAAATLMEAYKDLDDLLECDYGFLLGPWIADATKWANESDAPASYYEWQARSQVSTWWPIAPSARKLPITYTKLPVLDNYANKHWNGLVRDFYAKRVQCYVAQMQRDLPASKPPPSQCSFGTELSKSFLANYPASLRGSGGATPPPHWPYDASSLAAAQAWCCKHADCGGITHQNGRYEVRAGATPIANPSGSTAASSFLRKGLAKLDQANLTRCVVTAELDFTQATGGDYAQRAASDKTVALSRSLIDKYAGHF